MAGAGNSQTIYRDVTTFPIYIGTIKRSELARRGASTTVPPRIEVRAFCFCKRRVSDTQECG